MKQELSDKLHYFSSGNSPGRPVSEEVMAGGWELGSGRKEREVHQKRGEQSRGLSLFPAPSWARVYAF